VTGAAESRSERTLWTFPAGALDGRDSVKGYDVLCSDGRLGTVSWADYKPGESYLVVSYRHHLREVHHLVPAGAIVRVDHEARTCTLGVTVDQVRSSPEHDEPGRAVDWSYVDQFERGMLGGGFVWPYTDV